MYSCWFIATLQEEKEDCAVDLATITIPFLIALFASHYVAAYVAYSVVRRGV